ncbi:hypothetical protein, partial [Streptomyces sp. NPDC094468]|uniref:hypothetical protein n=1 Tax=Streptomyces sp. NPDC094468 TaxID=3366066 RepID=UPI00381BA259
ESSGHLDNSSIRPADAGMESVDAVEGTTAPPAPEPVGFETGGVAVLSPEVGQQERPAPPFETAVTVASAQPLANEAEALEATPAPSFRGVTVGAPRVYTLAERGPLSQVAAQSELADISVEEQLGAAFVKSDGG